jgi:hypothetical protein
VVGVVWRDLFGIVMPGEPTVDVPTWAAALALASTCALSVWLLDLRLRAREVVS